MIDQSIFDCLKQIQPNCMSYRQSVDQLFEPLARTGSWRLRYLDILVATTRLYLDHLLVMRHMPEFEAAAVKRRKTTLSETDLARERVLRNKLIDELEQETRWISFQPINLMSDDAGLIDLQGYKNRLAIHLPEIYEETHHVEMFAKSFLTNQNSAALARLSVTIEHIGNHHAIFVMPALEWLADEMSWTEPWVRGQR